LNRTQNLMSKKLKEHVKLIATAEDRATKDFFAVIRYCNVKGRFRRIMVPLASLDDASALRKELLNKGAYFAPDTGDPLSSIRDLQMAKEGAPHWESAKALGWSGGKFVHSKGVFGEQSEGCLLKAPRTLHDAVKRMGMEGTLRGWQRHVAEPARYSSRTVTAICAAFGAPLLKFAPDVGSFALYFTGPSKIGKSTSTLAAGSVIGFATEKALPNFRCTDAAFGELPGQFNDHVLPLNEFGLLRGTPRERRQRVRELTFGAAEGHGTTYSQLSPASGSALREYRSILVANGEETSDDLATRAGEIREGGEYHRWIDVPAIHVDSPDVFDMAPELDDDDRAPWFSKACADMREGCRRHHGVAIRHFLGSVISDTKNLPVQLGQLRGQFVEAVVNGESDHVVRHMARNFGHLYAAGVLAVRFKTVPWSEEMVMTCVRRCFRAARGEIKTEAELLSRGLRAVKAKAKRETILLSKRNGQSLKNVDGYRRQEGKKETVTVRAEAFKRWFNDRRQPRLVLDCLRQNGRLICSGSPGHGQGIKWAESQPTWPDGTRVRSVVISFRRPL
jgi:putative DNA primase/helicase